MSVLDILKTKCCQDYCYDILKLVNINLLQKHSKQQRAIEQQTGSFDRLLLKRCTSTSVCWKNIFWKIRCYATAPPRRHFSYLHSSVSVPTGGAATTAGSRCHCQPRPVTPSALTGATHPWIAQRTAAVQLPNQAKVANVGRGLEL